MPRKRHRVAKPTGTFKRFKTNRNFNSDLPLERYAPHRKKDFDPWPRRLLHVPTMTSVERTGRSNIYGTEREPSYNALSYTWGRYATANGNSPAIQIHNVTWTIPAVQAAHFTVAEFQAAIVAAAGGYPWLWLDIACIDQENHAVKVDEIGNQAAIFRRAAHVFAWLAPWKEADIERVLCQLEDACQPRCYRVKRTQAWPPGTLEAARDAVQTLTVQPWFTSLWTLQETSLRMNAVILSRSARTIPLALSIGSATVERPVEVVWLVRTCREIFDSLCLDDGTTAVTMCDTIQQSGLLALDTKNDYALSYASSKRQASAAEDYIYGIMQVYEIRLGVYSDLSELQDRFSQSLNLLNPTLAQLFVHKTPALEGKTWRAGRDAALPPVGLFAQASNTMCNIWATSRRKMYFRGRSCALKDLTRVWTTACTQTGQRGYNVHINLDAYDSRPCAFLRVLDRAAPTSTHVRSWLHWQTQKAYIDELSSFLKHPLSRYKVLLLGELKLCRLSTGGSSSSDFQDIMDQFEDHDAGLIVCQCSQDRKGPWVRVGVCSWEDDNPSHGRNKYSELRLSAIRSFSSVCIPIPESLWVHETLQLG